MIEKVRLKAQIIWYFPSILNVVKITRPLRSYRTPKTGKSKNSIRDACTPQPGKIVFNTMRYRGGETVHRMGYFQSSVSVQIMFK